MKKLIFLFAFLLALASGTADAQTFELATTGHYSPDDTVSVEYRERSYYRRRRDAQIASPIEYRLYRLPDPRGFISQHGFPHAGGLQPKAVMDKATLLRAWTEPVPKGAVSLGLLPEGLYLLEGISGGEAVSLPVLVSSFQLLQQDLAGVSGMAVCRTADSRPQEGFALYRVEEKGLALLAPVPNGKGLFQVKNPAQRYEQQLLLAIKGNSLACTQNYFNTTPRSTEMRGYLYADRSAYKPGQTIYFKGIVRERPLQALVLPAFDSMVICVADPSSQIIHKQKLPINDLGEFSGSIEIAEKWALGSYTLFADTVAPRSNYFYPYQNMMAEVQVQEYRKPEYEVKVAFDKAQYMTGEVPKVSVRADYFFGAPVANARVEYRILRKEKRLDYWRNWDYWWWYACWFPYEEKPEVVREGFGKIGPDGTLKFEFPTHSGPKDEQNYTYTVEANVIDGSRRYVLGSASATVAWIPYQMSLYTDQYAYSPQQEATVSVLLSDLQGTPIKQEAKVMIVRSFWDQYRHYQDTVQAPTALVTDPATGRAHLKLQNLKEGYYYAYAVLREGRRTVKASCNFYVFERNSRYNWWQKASQEVKVLTDKAVYLPGDTARITVIAPEGIQGGLFTANNQRLLDQRVLRTGDGGQGFGQIDLPLPEGLFGAVSLHFAYMNEGSFAYADAQFGVIPQQQSLRVSLQFDAATYQPGTWATATVQVLDWQGKPVPNASVSLSTADEALYSLYPDVSGNIEEKMYATNPRDWDFAQRPQEFYPQSSSQMVWPKRLAVLLREHPKLLKQGLALDSRQEYFGIRYLEQEPRGENGLIFGLVLDSATGQPLPGARVRIGPYLFDADADGYYAIAGLPESYQTDISFLHKGRELKLQRVFNTKTGAIYLNAAIPADRAEVPVGRDLIERPEAHTVPLYDAKQRRLEEESWREMPFSYIHPMARSAVSTGAAWGGASDDAFGGAGDMAAESGIVFQDATASDASDAKAPARMRSDFRDAIHWTPSVRTDAQGQAQLRIKLPDNLTTWRSLAKVATADSKVGQTEAKIVVTKKLLVRMEAPRFLTIGDRMIMATNVHNYLSESKEVQVSLVANGVEVEGTARTLQIPAHGEARVDWTVKAHWPGQATLAVKALTDEESDGMELQVPVQANGVPMLLARGVSSQEPGTQSFSFELPQGIDLNTAEVRISVVPGITAALLASMDELIGYPYGCVEQTMSRFLPNVLVANTLQQLHGQYEGQVDQAELAKMVDKGAKRLAELQRMDGSWGWWSNDNSSPYYTAYVMFGLQIAKQAGYALPEGLYEKGLEALRQQTQKRVAKGDATLEAYQMMVAQHCGLQGLWAPDRMALDSLSNAYQAGLWMQAATLAADYALADRLEYWLTDHLMREGDAQVYWGGKRFYYSWQDDRVETTASVVRALAMKNPRHPLLPQAAQWLLAQRRGTAWHNTRQTAMTIYGLHELIKHELGGTSEVAIYANGKQVGDYRFEAGDVGKVQQGREIVLRAPQATASAGGMLPEAGHLRAGLNEVRVETKAGQSYVNASIAYFLPKGHAQLKVQEKDAPFRVERAYFKLVPKTSEYGIVYQRMAVTPQNVKAGDVIMVETIVHSNDRREHVLVEDFIPAGCAFIQGDEAKGYVLEEEASNRYSGWGGDWNDGWGGWGNWFTHEEYRHNRYALTITHLGEGQHRYRYLMRAEAPGQYEANPALVQLMYYPEVRGFSTFGGLVVGKK